jgi:hypothetical protein
VSTEQNAGQTDDHPSDPANHRRSLSRQVRWEYRLVLLRSFGIHVLRDLFVLRW